MQPEKGCSHQLTLTDASGEKRNCSANLRFCLQEKKTKSTDRSGNSPVAASAQIATDGAAEHRRFRRLLESCRIADLRSNRDSGSKPLRYLLIERLPRHAPVSP